MNATSLSAINIIWDGTSTQLALLETTGQLQLQWGNVLHRFDNINVSANTDTIVCVYIERITDAQWRLRASISTHNATTSATININTQTPAGTERIIGHLHRAGMTDAGFVGRMWDLVMACPNANLSADDVLSLTRPTFLSMRENLYGITALGQNPNGTTPSIPATAFMQNLLANPVEVRGDQRSAFVATAFPANWRDFTELKIDYAISRDESIDPSIPKAFP